MKTKIAATMTCTLLTLLLLGTIPSLAALSPNYAKSDHEDLSIYYYGYVQIKPSFVENGNHAVRGYMRYWRYTLSGVQTGDTGRLYTGYGSGPSDTRIISRSYTYTDSLIPNQYKTQFRYGFEWVPDGTGIWPVNIPPVTE